MKAKVRKDTVFKQTPQRLAIMEYLTVNKGHPSADEIYKAMAGRFPTMSFSTVYNTLQALKKKGMVIELSIDPGRKRFDATPSHHHHLMCIRCRKIVDIERQFHIRLGQENAHGFEVVGNHIEFYGICTECRGQGKATSRQ